MAGSDFEIDLSDEDFKKAYEAIDSTIRYNLFITGGAGTGKSLILESFYKRLTNAKENVVVVCPTGISASILRDKGLPATTIHSFFLLPPNPIFEKKLEIPRERLRIMKHLDYIMIDEVSMLSPSLFDHIMWILWQAKFKGSLILFGDAMQLSPVVNLKDTATYDYYLSNGYITPTYITPQFYDSHTYKETIFKTYFLQKQYRQKKQGFRDILSRIRFGEQSDEDLEILNERVVSQESFYQSHDDMLYLTPLNKNAQRINEKYNQTFIGKPYMDYMSKSVGSMKKETEDIVRIYLGQQVMCIHNNSEEGYQNGTIGRVVELNKDSLQIMTNDFNIINVTRDKWSDYKIDYNKTTGEVSANEIGAYEQIGCKPTFAITIHKSQGLTLNSVYIDINSYYIPYAGIYLALSRAKTLEGIGLSRKITHNDIKVNKDVKQFYLNLLSKQH